jgi:2'-5' RNA ligase
MSQILHVVEALYKDTMWIGSNQGKRSLNHGVCSGLIVLQALTFFHELFWGFESEEAKKWEMNEEAWMKAQKDKKVQDVNRVSLEMFKDFKSKIIDVPAQIKIRGGFLSDFWFKKVLWATASAAIHALIQKEDYKKKCKDFVEEGQPHLTIHYNNDPLAFLGGLTDVLQEWDRYTVSGESAFSDTELLQSSDVIVEDSYKNGAIYFYYPNAGNGRKKWEEDLTKSMNNCLEGWTDIVEIKPVPEDGIN